MRNFELKIPNKYLKSRNPKKRVFHIVEPIKKWHGIAVSTLAWGLLDIHLHANESNSFTHTNEWQRPHEVYK